ncbi:Mor family transcriptional regulator [Chitinivorax tropicus]|uniref:Mor family transcriptional regulator n=1 Tax=Chitinivorax tropicus TaxID=714531 RepID=A0A840MLJ0_9PROT|nr:Mor transcription activator family protein [Chitinivorax tropicus]MBB5017406.1 Mor family transcriptional regulator [Chitinivorax tropicus]
MKETFRSKGPELLTDLAQHVAASLVELAKLDKDRSEQVGRVIADRMANHWGGQNIYFPMGLTQRTSDRDDQIYREFTGSNHAELARKYGVSLQWIYKIVKNKREQELAAKRPPTLQ